MLSSIMLESLLIILVPMVIGYAVKIKETKILHQFGKITMLLLYLILFIMGISLGQLDNLAQQPAANWDLCANIYCFYSRTNLSWVISL